MFTTNEEVLETLVLAKEDVFTSNFSDDYSVIKRDAIRYQNLLESQNIFTDEQITKLALKILNGECSREEIFG